MKILPEVSQLKTEEYTVFVKKQVSKITTVANCSIMTTLQHEIFLFKQNKN